MFSESPGCGGEQDTLPSFLGMDRVPGPEAATPRTKIGDNGRANGESGLHRVWGSPVQGLTARSALMRVMFENSTVCHAIYVVVICFARCFCIFVGVGVLWFLAS